MVKIWSELPTRRLKEQVADVATLGWVVLWGTIAWQLFSFLAGFAVAGRAVRSSTGSARRRGCTRTSAPT